MIKALFGLKKSDDAWDRQRYLDENDLDDDDQPYSSPNYSYTSYRDEPSYQKLLGITKEDRERERAAENRADDDDDDEPKKGWFGLW